MAKKSTSQRWSRAWLRSLRTLDLLTAEESATGGNRVRRMEVMSGEINAEVQTRDGNICQVTIRLIPLPEHAWQGVIEVIQQQLAGVPLVDPQSALPRKGGAFRELTALLLPEATNAIQSICSCCQPGGITWEQNCTALQTVYRQLGLMFDEEPILLLRARGRQWQQVVQALENRQNLELGNGGTTMNHPAWLPAQSGDEDDSTTRNHPDDLLTHLGSFWGSRRELETFHHYIMPPTIDLAMLRRLGSLPKELSDPMIDQQLAELYQSISQQAQSLAYDLENQTDSS